MLTSLIRKFVISRIRKYLKEALASLSAKTDVELKVAKILAVEERIQKVDKLLVSVLEKARDGKFSDAELDEIQDQATTVFEELLKRMVK